MCAKSKEDKEAKKAAAAAAKAEKAAAKAKGKAKPKKKQNAGVNEYNFFVLHGEWLLAAAGIQYFKILPSIGNKHAPIPFTGI